MAHEFESMKDEIREWCAWKQTTKEEIEDRKRRVELWPGLVNCNHSLKKQDNIQLLIYCLNWNGGIT